MQLTGELLVISLRVEIDIEIPSSQGDAQLVVCESIIPLGSG